MIDCKSMAREIEQGIIDRGRGGHLAVISVGDDPASQAYVRAKKKACERVGFGFTHKRFDPDKSDPWDVADVIEEMNKDEDISGIIVQMPTAWQVKGKWGAGDESVDKWLTSYICPNKDVDGLRTDSLFKPCTPEGILHILHHELGSLEGKTVCVVGRGKLVGKPLREMLDEENATVISCNSHTQRTPRDQLYNLCYDSDAIVLATGQKQWFPAGQFPDETVIVDCGCFKGEDGKLHGEAYGVSKNQRITPVPGGVGPMTVAKLLEHTERKE